MAGDRLAGAGVQHPGHRVVLGLGHPQPVGGLHRHLPGDVGAAVPGDVGQPGGGVGVALLAVGGVVDGQQVERVVGEGRAAGLVPGEGAGLPAVAERDHVVDVDAAAVALLEPDRLPGVGVGEGAGHHDTVAAGLQRLVDEVAGQDVVAGVAAVAVDVGPLLPELVAVVAGLRRAALDRQPGQHVGGALTGGGSAGLRLPGGLGHRVGGRGGRGDLAAGGAQRREGDQDGEALFHVEPPGIGRRSTLRAVGADPRLRRAVAATVSLHTCRRGPWDAPARARATSPPHRAGHPGSGADGPRPGQAGSRASRRSAARPSGVPGQCRVTAAGPARRTTDRRTIATRSASSA